MIRRLFRYAKSWARPDEASVVHRFFREFPERVNRGDSPILLSHRPDFELLFGGFPEFERYRGWWIHGNSWNNLWDLARLYSLVLNARQLVEEGVPGDFVEVGVYKGNSAAVLADLARGAGRRLVLFDTFAGFDERDARSEGLPRTDEFDDTSLMAVRKLVGDEGVHYVQGFFPESLAKAPVIDRVALLHLDCDLHDPMRAGLEAFYTRLAPGACVVIHDYSSGHWPGTKRAVDHFLEDKPERLILLPDRGGSALFRKT